MEEFDSSGNHIQLTTENAQETIALAIEQSTSHHFLRRAYKGI